VWAAGACGQELTFVKHEDRAVEPDGLRVEFDHERVVSHPGVETGATLAGRLGIEVLPQRPVRLRHDRPGAANSTRQSQPRRPTIRFGRTWPDECSFCLNAAAW
jgi:hypothetical protein